MRNKLVAGSRKNFLSYTTCLAGAAAAALSLAPVSASAQDAAVEGEEEIVVTGTRIRQNDFEFASPVASADAETIVRSGNTSLTDFLTDMPALLSSFDSEASADTSGPGTQGLNLLDLRGLGTQRTLVLVDGRRHVSGGQFDGGVDVNSIPVDLVERVEVLTGGASAIYGADAVTGVVNFIMRDDFEGLSARVQYGEASEGGGEDSFLSVVAGTNFGQGRGNFAIGFETALADGVDRDQRHYTRLGRGEGLIEVPGGGGPYTNDFFRNVRYIDTSPGGSVAVDFDGIYLGGPDTTGSVDGNGSLSGMDYLGDGSLWDEGEQSGSGFMVGGSGTLLDEFNDQLLPGLDRYTVNLRSHYDLGVHRVFGEVKWSHTETFFVAQPTFDFGLFMSLDNPFIPANIVADALQPGNIGFYYGGVFMFRDNIDLGNTTQEVTRDTYRTVIGLQGPVTDNIDYEVSMVWGRVETENVYRTRNDERWFAAVDVVDNGSGPECRTSSGNTFAAGECVPANIWGENLTQEAIDWIMTDLTHTITNSQYVLNAFVSGTSADWFSLPAGPVGFATGVEYREEESEYDHDNRAESLPDGTFWNGAGVDSFGRYDVAEIFGEVEVPLLADMPFAEELTVDAAYRFSNYSSVGSTDTWKYGLIYRPTDWLMLRGTEARAVRAPNITELYQPTTVTSELINDPCDQSNVNAGSAVRYANCLAAFTALGLADPDPNNFVDTTSSSIDGLFLGNPDLEAETAETTTYGFVLEPTFLPGLSMSVDYWEISLDQAIQFLDSQDIIDFCYDLPQPNQYCDLVQRTPVPVISTSSPAGGIIFFQRQAVNVAQFLTSGIDFSVRYRLDPSDWGLGNIGRFQLAGNATQLRDFTFLDAVGSRVEQVDDPLLPEWQTVLDVTWLIGDFTLNYGWSWHSETERFDEAQIANDPQIVDPAYFNYSERSVHDVFASYDFTEKFQIYGGVNNLFQQEPDRGIEAYPVSQLGRFFYLGARARF